MTQARCYVTGVNLLPRIYPEYVMHSQECSGSFAPESYWGRSPALTKKDELARGRDRNGQPASLKAGCPLRPSTTATNATTLLKEVEDNFLQRVRHTLDS